ncbi:MAG: DNA ligase-associated DEXH box helicase [Chlamydiales bacterium 38-26]|nr:ligase-associated DNA damage response exonuclease [Chlamydiales bacterium]OJV07468.1 MAG: DNA ligase-associated DEXH box helicase [Chlamydiales bacterium 38-26]
MQPHSIIKTRQGIYCDAGQCFIDPWSPTPVALITHAHGDHAYTGSDLYYCSKPCEAILRYRLGADARIIAKPYREKFKLGQAWISFHPAGHILGSSQIRIEVGSNVTVISGDYKRQVDPTCEPFEVLLCDEFLTESTFALPIYSWPSPEQVAQDIFDWWQKNAQQEQASILFCYALGKAQHVQSLLKKYTDQPVLVHGAIAALNQIYEQEGVVLSAWKKPQESDLKNFTHELILAPPSAAGSPWLKRFAPYKTALASGWMAVRGTRRRKGFDTGFILSDHADWNALIGTIEETCAKKVWVTHGNEEVLARYLHQMKKIEAYSFHLAGWSSDEGED